MRGWTLDRDFDDESDMKKKIREEMINKLAAEWNTYHSKLEAYQFRSQEDIDEENAWLGDQFMDEAYEAEEKALQNGASEEDARAIREAAYKAACDLHRSKENEDVTRMNVIEELLGELGARMMRPYEHWNEDERYMEYMENRYEEDERY